MPEKALTVGSLFSGIQIGGFDLGFERAGMSTRWFCEQDEFCTRVLNKHWPDVPVYPDVTELKGTDVEPVDVLCGGFPCQDLSVAGRGAGLAGARSGLWFEYARLIDELRPRYVVVENVRGLLARGMGVVVGELAELGFDAEWAIVPASAVGAPHLRERVWIVAYPCGEGRREVAGGAYGDEGQDEGRAASFDHVVGGVGPKRLCAGGRDADVADSDGEGQLQPAGLEQEVGRRFGCGGSEAVADADAERRDGRARVFGQGWWRELADDRRWLTQPGVRGADDGLSDWVDGVAGLVEGRVPNRSRRVSALGNALVPQIAEWVGRRIVAYETEQSLECVA